MLPENDAQLFEVVEERLFSAVIADALDGLGVRGFAPSIAFPLTSVRGVVAGRARTLLWCDIAFEDPRPYELELEAVDRLVPGDLVICSGAGSRRSAVWGGLLSTAAKARGARGAVVDGAVRDLRALRDAGFPVFARGACVLDSRNRQRVVEIDVPVDLGGALVRPHDLVVADEDGVVVVPRELEREALERAFQKAERESAVRKALSEGMSAREVFKLYGVL